MSATLKDLKKLSYRINIISKYLTAFILLCFQGLVASEELVVGYAITSKKALVENGFQKITYLGDVELTHKRFKISGDILTSSYVEGRSSGFSVSGNPCSFIGPQKMDTDPLVASAKEIIYKQPEQVLIFRGEVVFAKNGDTLEASFIKYDITTQEISATSAEGDSPIRLVIKSR